MLEPGGNEHTLHNTRQLLTIVIPKSSLHVSHQQSPVGVPEGLLADTKAESAMLPAKKGT